MTRETFKLNPVTDGLREIIIQYDSEHSRLEITSRTKRRMIIEVTSLSSGILESSSRPLLYGPSDKSSIEAERDMSRSRSLLGDRDASKAESGTTYDKERKYRDAYSGRPE
jgi:hypothetical protein